MLTREAWVASALLTALTLPLQALPLLATPGYDLGLLLAPAAAVAAVVVVQRRFRREGPPSDWWTLLGRCLAAAALPLAPLLVALVISAARGLICEPLREGALALSMASGAAFWAAALGSLAVALGGPGGRGASPPRLPSGPPRPRRAGRIAAAAAGAWIAWDLAYLLSEPPVFIFNPLIGYFAGPIYDTHIPLDRRFLWARLIDLSVALAFLRVAHWRLGRGSGWSALVVAGCAVLALALRPQLGIRPHRRQIEVALGSRLDTAHFRVHYDGRATPPAVLHELALDLEWHLERISALLAIELPPARVGCYIYPDAATKKYWMGAGATSIEDPIAGEIHVNLATPPHPVLAHELAHVLSAPLGLPGIGISRRFGLVEGLASALGDRPTDRLTLHQRAAALRRLGLMPDLERLLGATGFWSEAGPRAYPAMGSFVRWLLTVRGPELFGRAYPWGAIEETYGESLDHLVAQWWCFLDGVSLQMSDLRYAELLFARPSILRRRCAHAVARHEQQAGAHFRSGRFRAAARSTGRALVLSPGRPTARLTLGRCERRAGDRHAETTLRAIVAERSAPSQLREAARLELGDLHWTRSEPGPALRAWREVAAAPVSLGLRRAATIRLAAERFEPATLTSIAADSRVAEGGVIASALRGLDWRGAGATERAITALESALAGPELPAELRATTALALARSLSALGRFAEAGRALDSAAANATSSGEERVVANESERLSWLAASPSMAVDHFEHIDVKSDALR